MKINKTVSVNAITTDGEKMLVDHTYVFNAYGNCLCGVYKGFAKKGALIFEGVISGTNVTFNVHPKAISDIYEAIIDSKQDIPFA